jgi:hypothetical protein
MVVLLSNFGKFKKIYIIFWNNLSRTDLQTFISLVILPEKNAKDWFKLATLLILCVSLVMVLVRGPRGHSV